LSALDTLKRYADSGEGRAKLSGIDKKKIGYLCAYVPEELILAAGMHPYRITGSGEEDLSQADSYIPMNSCGFCRSALVEGLRNGEGLLSGVVATDCCDSMRRLFDTWCHFIESSFTHLLWIPHKSHQEGLDAFVRELTGFKEHLEEFTGEEIGDGALERSLSLYNQSRRLLGELYAGRKEEYPTITGTEALEVVKAGFVLPREEYNGLLAELLEEVEGRDAYDDEGPRILITGSICADLEYVSVVEEGGGMVVADDICTGSRYFLELAEEGSTDPLKAIGKRYLNRIPCSRMYDYERRVEHILRTAEEYQVQGIIYSVLKFCDPYQYDYPIFRDKLEDAGYPLLKIDREHNAAGIGQISTRVQAFLEMLV
jgi:bzd-type benzoyl-CoA reductase N subunit